MKKRLLMILMSLVLTVGTCAGTVMASQYPEAAISVGGTAMTLNSDYDSSIIPDGYYEAELSYNGEVFYGGRSNTDDSDCLYYVRCDSDASKTGWYRLTNGNFELFKATEPGAEAPAADTTQTTATGSYLEGKALTLQVSEPGDDVDIPVGYEKTQVAASSDFVTAYKKTDAQGAAEYAYLVYGTTDGTNYAWYVYDQNQETIQRFMNNSELQALSQQEDDINKFKSELEDLNKKYNYDVSRSKNMFIVSGLVAILCLCLMINAIIRRKHTEMDLEDRIIDLKNNRGEETQTFSKSESRRYARLDDAARARYSRGDGRGMDAFEDSYLTDEEFEDMYDGNYGKKSSGKPAKNIKPVKPSKSDKNAKPARSDKSAKSDRNSRGGKESRRKMDYEDPYEGFSEYGTRGEMPRPSRSGSSSRPEAVRRSSESSLDETMDMSQSVRSSSRVDQRQVTLSAAGDSRDFDLDLLEKNLGKMTDDIMNAPEPERKMQRFRSEMTELTDDYSADFIDL